MVRASTSPESGARAQTRPRPRPRAENPGVDRQTRAARCADRRACHRADLPDRVHRARFIAGGYREFGAREFSPALHPVKYLKINLRDKKKVKFFIATYKPPGWFKNRTLANLHSKIIHP